MAAFYLQKQAAAVELLGHQIIVFPVSFLSPSSLMMTLALAMNSFLLLILLLLWI
jgi:hypothetical protein